MKSFNFTGSSGSRPQTEINITALVDVMTVLLIIFMITTPMIQSGVQVELPKAKAAAPDMEDGIVITLTRDGSLYLEERELSVSEFDAVFSAIYSKTEDRPVFIRGDAEIRYREIIQIIDRLKGHGVTKIGLATDLQMSR